MQSQLYSCDLFVDQAVLYFFLLFLIDYLSNTINFLQKLFFVKLIDFCNKKQSEHLQSVSTTWLARIRNHLTQYSSAYFIVLSTPTQLLILNFNLFFKIVNK